MTEFPDSAVFTVRETHYLDNGKQAVEVIAGPFDEPDQARRFRDQIRESQPGRNVHCVVEGPV